MPMRNLVFHSVALAIAESMRANIIVAGFIKTDSYPYRDATRDYLEGIYSVANSGTYPFGDYPAAHIELRLPLIDKTDPEVILLGQTLMAPLELSWPYRLDEPGP